MDMHFDGVIFQSYAEELERRASRSHPPYSILDVRGKAEYASGHIAGALSTSAAELNSSLPPGTTASTEFFIVGSGPTDERVRETSLALRRNGARRCVELPGGMIEWRQSGYSVETG